MIDYEKLKILHDLIETYSEKHLINCSISIEYDLAFGGWCCYEIDIVDNHHFCGIDFAIKFMEDKLHD